MSNIENEQPEERGHPSEENETKHTYEYNACDKLSYFLGGSVLNCPLDWEDVSSYLEDKQTNNQYLRMLSNWAYGNNGMVTNGINYMSSMHTLDNIIYSKSKGAIKKNRNRNSFIRVLNDIRYKSFIRNALQKILTEGTIIYYFENNNFSKSNIKYLSDLEVETISEINESSFNTAIIPLPLDWCKIIGTKNGCYVGAFNLRYFECLLPHERENKLRAFPKEIRNAWNKFSSGKISNSWIVLDNTKTIIRKINAKDTEPWGVPITISALEDILYEKHFTKTKKNILQDLNNQIFYETYPEGKEKGTSGLTDTQQKEQHRLVKDAIFKNSNEYGKAFFSLAAGTVLDQLKVDTSLFDEKNESNLKNNTAQDIGFDPSILGGKTSSNYAIASLNLENIAAYVYTIISDIVDELNKVINKNVIKDYKNPTQMYVLPTTFINRDKLVGYMKDLYCLGKGSLQAWISSTGIDSNAYIELMEQELEDDFENKFPVHKLSYTLSGKDASFSDVDKSTGAPQKNNIENENTLASKTKNSNSNPRRGL